MSSIVKRKHLILPWYIHRVLISDRKISFSKKRYVPSLGEEYSFVEYVLQLHDEFKRGEQIREIRDCASKVMIKPEDDVSNILMKIAGIFYIKDIGVLLYVPLCVGFGKFTFSDSGDSAKKNMTVFLKHGI